MKKLLTAGALVLGASLCLQDVSTGHGGTYRGPGDTVPPGGGGGGGGGGPAGPGPAGPSSPGPGGPSTPGPASGGPAAGPAQKPGGPVTGAGAEAGPDLTLWEFWWGFNKEPYLNLKSHIHSGQVATGTDDFFLGEGEQSQARDSLKPSEEAIRGQIVPAMLAALESERQNDIVTACLIGLAKIGDAKGEGGESGFEPQIAKFLSDSNQEISETAAVSLGILANEASTDTLIGLLNDTPEARKLTGRTDRVATRTRAFAAYGLGLIGNRTASEETRQKIVESLVAMLEGEALDMPLRDVPVACVISLGLVPLQFDPDFTPPGPEAEAESAPPAHANRQTQIEWLMGYYKNEKANFLVRAHVPTAMARLLEDVPEDSGLKAAVVGLLLPDIGRHSKAEKELVQSCVLSLGMIADADGDKLDADVREGLAAVVDTSADQQAGYFSMIAMAQAGGQPGRGAEPTVGSAEMRKALLKHLARSPGGKRQWAALGLGVLERSMADANFPVDPDAAQAMRAALDDAKSVTDIGAIAIGAGIMADVESKDVLLEKLDTTRDPSTRGFVAVALGLLDARDSILPIQEIVRSSKYQPDLLKSAAIGLGLLGDKELVPDLVKMLDEARGLASQAAIAQALGFIGDVRSIDPLIVMLQDQEKTALARAFAAVALGIVADKEPLPWNSKISTNINYRANTQTLTDNAQGTGILDIL